LEKLAACRATTCAAGIPRRRELIDVSLIPPAHTVADALSGKPQPVDLVLPALGSNDLKNRYCVSSFEIASSADSLINLIQKSSFGPDGGAPQVLLICPPPLGKMG
jgi:hypothetical protein